MCGTGDQIRWYARHEKRENGERTASDGGAFPFGEECVERYSPCAVIEGMTRTVSEPSESWPIANTS